MNQVSGRGCLDSSGCVARVYSVAWMVQAVWPGSTQLLGWFRLCGQGLLSCLDGSGCVARVYSVAWIVQAVWPGSCLDGSGCVARV